MGNVKTQRSTASFFTPHAPPQPDLSAVDTRDGDMNYLHAQKYCAPFLGCAGMRHRSLNDVDINTAPRSNPTLKAREHRPSHTPH